MAEQLPLEPLDPVLVAADIAALRGQVEDLSVALTHLMRDTEKVTPSRWSWRDIDPLAADKLRRELADWVGWLRGRYAPVGRTIPGCWAEHPVAVEELTALMAAWRNAYHGSDLATDALITWHDRSLWPCIDRLPKVAGLGACGREHLASATLDGARSVDTRPCQRRREGTERDDDGVDVGSRCDNHPAGLFAASNHRAANHEVGIPKPVEES